MITMEQDKWLYHNTLKWKGEKKADLRFIESKQEIEVATPPEFGGHENIISPEDLFVSSANVCYMTIFTKIIIRPKIKAKETEEKIRMILNHAEKRCLVANSMKTQVIIEPDIETV